MKTEGWFSFVLNQLEIRYTDIFFFFFFFFFLFLFFF